VLRPCLAARCFSARCAFRQFSDGDDGHLTSLLKNDVNDSVFIIMMSFVSVRRCSTGAQATVRDRSALYRSNLIYYDR
jgi:hypothetical protein